MQLENLLNVLSDNIGLFILSSETDEFLASYDEHNSIPTIYNTYIVDKIQVNPFCMKLQIFVSPPLSSSLVYNDTSKNHTDNFLSNKAAMGDFWGLSKSDFLKKHSDFSVEQYNLTVTYLKLAIENIIYDLYIQEDSKNMAIYVDILKALNKKYQQ